jgi:predicted ATPase/class 3 adenylate cyclase
MKPEELLHLFGPYLPTDRFRALLRNSEIPLNSEGAALLVDVVGFTPLTTQLVSEYGPEWACDELKHRLNPMLEAIAGLVFHHGGSVISFTGDGFIAWFDDHPIGQMVENGAGVPALLRAVTAGLDMQTVMPLFRGLQLRICIGAGLAHRWVVGQPQHGLNDVISGPAVEAMHSLAGESQSGQVLIHHDAIPLLRSENVNIVVAETGNAMALTVPETIAKAARRHRWPAWAIEGDVNNTLHAVRSFVSAVIRERVESGIGDFVAELRYALPVFIRIGHVKPETAEVRDTLDNYVRSAQDVLSITGGRLVSVEVSGKGSVLFAVFGAPVTHGDDAERAVYAALMLHDLAVANDTIAALRIGISRGLLYAGTIGGEARREYSTIGDETNIAARLMAAAGAGQTLVSSAVREAVGPRIVFRDLLPVMVKGKAKPIPVAEPLSVQSGRQPQTHVGKFVGRQAELIQLRQGLAAAREGRPRILRLEGPAGIGKSRLIDELSAVAASEGCRVACGNSLSTGRSIPYLPWRSVMAGLLGLDATPDDQATAIARLTHIVEQIDPRWLPRLPLLGDVLNWPIRDTPTTASFEGQTRHQALSAIVTDLILHLARQQPLLLILEDVQWLDEVSEALAIDLARRLNIESARLMLVLSHQPPDNGTLELFHVLNNMVIHTHLRVEELAGSDMVTLVEGYLRAHVPVELARFVQGRAHGNPFFAHEIVDSLRETGHVRVIGNTAFIERNLQSADLPLNVQGLVLARVDRLGEMNKLVLKVAAVIGREFQVRVLAASLPVPMKMDELLSRLRTLEEHDFVRVASTEPELVYQFTHTIVLEIAYQSMLHVQRQQLHMAVAMALETLASDTIERLAYHFARSGSGKRAGRYMVLAGQKAAREYANQAALGYFTQALALAGSSEEKFSVNHQRLQVMLRLGDLQGVQAELPDMQQRAVHDDRADWQAMVHILWASLYAQTSAWPGVIASAQEAIRFALALGDHALAWEAYRLLHSALLGINQPEEAHAINELMEPLTAWLDDPRRSIEFALMQIEDASRKVPQASIEQARELIVYTREVGDPLLETACWSALIGFYLRVSDYAAAMDAARQQIELLRQVGDRRREGRAQNRIGMILVNLGQFSEGNKCLLDAYQILHQLEERAGEAISFTYLGVIASHYKAYGEALAYLNRSLVIQRELKIGLDAAFTLFQVGNVYIAQNELDMAAQALDEARAYLDAIGQTTQIEEIDLALAEIEARRGDPDSAAARVKPMLSRLLNRQVVDLFAPGLAYWRATMLLDQFGNADRSEVLRAAFRSEVEIVLGKLPDARWRESYVNAIWYHAALLSK